MSNSVRSGAVRLTHDPLDAETGELSVPVGDIFDRLWHLFISMRTGLALMLGLAVLTLLGAVIVQAPPGMQADPQTYATWLDGVRPKYGGWTNVLDLLGLFSVFSSVLFRTLTLLLATSILACSVNRAPRLWRQAVHPRVVASPGFFEHVRLAGEVDTRADEAVALAALEGELARRHFRTIVTRDATGVAIYADRFRWGPFGTVIAHLSLIVIMAGAVLGAAGFRDEGLAVAVGSTVAVGNGTNLTIQAMSFSDSYYENGSPADYASHLILYENGQQVAERTIRVNDPLRYGDVKVFQSFYGPAADVVVKDAAGAILFEDGVPLVWQSTDETKVIGQFAVPSQDLTVYVISVASGRIDRTIKPGQMQVEIYKGANTTTPVGIEVLDPGKPVTVAGLEFTFVRERQYTGLIVARDPGGPLVWLGALLLVVGVMLVFFFPARRIWARISSATGSRITSATGSRITSATESRIASPTGSRITSPTGSRIQVAALASHDVTFETAFRSLIDDVALATGESRTS